MGQLTRVECCDGDGKAPWDGQALHVKEQLWKKMGLSYGTGGSLGKRLWVIIRGQASKGDIMVRNCYGPPKWG